MEKLDRDQSTRRNTFWPQLPAGQRAQRYRENEESTFQKKKKLGDRACCSVESKAEFPTVQGFPLVQK
ncbi:hypothetical protein K0M31_017818 [Melipona bicolor]|uniref:Uncharacterized protein n=1 Tax=Melipona bicolor TaxID=60889 RepID=A0AA40G5V0_9HYME|nr:hypothetical protein K0M31_017818 [Melipona bicolor]